MDGKTGNEEINYQSRIIDLEEAIRFHALEAYQITKAISDAKLEDFSFDIKYDKLNYNSQPPEYTDDEKNKKISTQILDKSTFTNSSDLEQQFELMQEKETKDRIELSVTGGFKPPPGLQPIQMMVDSGVRESSQGMPVYITMDGTARQILEYAVKWSVQQQIKVTPNTTIEASIVLEEVEYPTRFKMLTRLDGKVAVTMTHKETAKVTGHSLDITEVLDRFKYVTINPDRRHAEIYTEGIVHFKYGVNKKITVTPVEELSLW